MRDRSIGFRLAAWYFLVFACGVAAFSVIAWFAAAWQVRTRRPDRVFGTVQPEPGDRQRELEDRP
jgi:hypothetical protein